MRMIFYLIIFSVVLSISCSSADEPQTAPLANEGVPETLWSETINGMGSIDIELDESGTAYVSGDYTGIPGVNGLQQVTTGIRNGFFLRYGNDGNLTTVMDLGLQVFQDINHIALGTDGQVYLSGLAVDFQNVMYLILDPTTQTQIRNSSISGSGNDRPGGMTLDHEGNVILGGRFNGTVRLENVESALGAILGTAMVAKFNAAGEPSWLFASPIPTASTLQGLDVDPEGNVYCYECAADLIYLRKLSPSGELMSTIENLGPCGAGIEVVSSSEIYLNTVSDVLRLDGEGNIIWSVKTTTQLNDLSVANGLIVVAGRNFSGGTFGNIELPGRSDTFMAQITTDGNVLWVSTEQGATDVSINDSGRIAFANFTNNTFGVME